MHKNLRTAFAASLLAIAAPALAQGWYIGAGLGYADASTSASRLGLDNANADGNDTSYTLKGGYQFNPYLAVEIGYSDFGKFTFSGSSPANVVTGSVKSKGYGLSAVVSFPLTEQFAPYASLGFGRSKVEVNVNTSNLTGSQGDWRSETMYGVGARYMFSREWGVFGEWTKFDDVRVDNYTLGVRLNF